jgi:AcrR family transcriptional regulator
MNELIIHLKEGDELPRTEEANQRIREEQRAKILDAARKVFARKGMTATMADVAAAAEVSQGLAYRYFASKEAIFHVLVEQAVQSGIAGIQRIPKMPGTPWERLGFLVSMAWEGRREHPENYQLMYQVLDDEATSEDIRELIGKQGQIYLEVLRQLIVEGQASGEVAEGDPDQLVIVLLSCLDGLSRLALREPEWVKKHFPETEIILRIFKPSLDRK